MASLSDILLLWDIDGTILSAKGAGPKAFERATFHAFGEEIPLSSINWPGATDYAIAYAILEKAGREVTREAAQGLVDKYLSHLPDLLESTNAKANPGVLHLLEHFHLMPHVHQALLTGNVKCGSDIKLGYIGVNHYFLFGAFADHSDFRNDLSTHALDLARQHLHEDWSPEQVYVIGDTPKDIECGKHIGAHTVAVATGHHTVEQLMEHEPSLVLESFDDPQILISYLNR
ncbi:MAG: HAD hydrolase-like protein [Verrucomicrobia bacterium]|nr:HAD hydrolase-like protein [Verrucomicrobiota bacterium]MDA1064998.1 HAD hydrolase-like protein [Verrucomicrobiota bacterium]